ncbi:phytochrome two-component sensor histidine kinase [Jejuia pallidilutea]|nr:phytochrome two-component sensor histidine kinase [Jejuia pallidilutea]
MAYKQIMRMQESADMVAHTLRVYNAIGDLTSHYSKADSEEFRNEILKNKAANSTIAAYKQEGKTVINNLEFLVSDNESQRAHLKPLKALLNSLYSQLTNLDSITYTSNAVPFEIRENQKSKINKTLFDIRGIKNRMQKQEENLLKKREIVYKSHKSTAPIVLLVLAFFALFVFIISFYKIYLNKLEIRKSEFFLKTVLNTTDNIVNYYEPIFDAHNSNHIKDFKIVFANNRNYDYLGLQPKAITGKTFTETFPFLVDNGDFDKLVKSYKENQKVELDREVIVKNKKMWFYTLVTPLLNGILITSRNATYEEKTKAAQLELKKRLEKQNLELLDNRAFLGNLFKSISHVVMHFKSIRDKNNAIIDFEILFVNDKINPITSDIPSEIKNKKTSEIFPGIFNDGVFENLVQAIETQTPITYEVPYYENGYEQWFKATAIKLGDGVTVTTVDITEEKKKSDQLIQLNERLSVQNTIFADAERLAATGSYIWDIDDDVSELSDNYYRLLGCEPNEFKLSFKTYRSFIHPDDLQEYDKKGLEIAKNKRIEEHTYRIITKQGNVKYLKTNGQFIKKNNKTVVVGVVQDVTDVVEFENKLKQSNDNLKFQNTFLEDAEVLGKMGSFRVNTTNNSSEISDNIYRMLDCKPHEFAPTPKAYFTFVHPDDLSNFKKNINKILVSKTFKPFRCRIITKNETVKYFKFTGHFDTYNEDEYLFGLIQDVTDDIKAEAFLKLKNRELTRSNAELESFNRVASHDLQEPLRKLQLFVSRIEDREGDQLSEKGTVYFGKIKNAVTRMQALISNLLTYSRIDSTKKDFEKVNLNQTLDKVKDDLADRIKEANAFIIADKLPKIKGVVFQVEQLFTNILSNALKYKSTNKAPKVQIVYKKVSASELPKHIIKESKKYHRISFIDNGIGFDSKHSKKIFEVFQRLHQKTEYSGTGIGLAICEKIVENHNGYIFAKGEVGVGSEFVVYFPA